MTDWVYKHISARIPGSHEHYLINAFGLLYEEVSASNLVTVDVHGKLVEGVPLEVNPAAFVIHGAIHAARPDVGCVLPTHTSTRAPNDDTPPSPTWVGRTKPSCAKWYAPASVTPADGAAHGLRRRAPAPRT